MNFIVYLLALIACVANFGFCQNIQDAASNIIGQGTRAIRGFSLFLPHYNNGPLLVFKQGGATNGILEGGAESDGLFEIGVGNQRDHDTDFIAESAI
ncbi:uncharacterized protein CELE_Y51A2A.12 [Caenorhabditis elegans]|uniref:Secreted protein n=1 Tax=Caenorhabditis elegans TaxID=6239 RepID=A9IG05_CAEEL|nr:Secreted protein [Caenorhabditis elegans]CAP46781.2 Secreted protein [Caenorhabditis elegans]|eukprot:NP_001123052.2 Uncharacterized protein CELE_Y51A2A.12 [Caenorhabditis elegans]